ncbi:Chorein [Giardia lamblia P15]|uniref:Chorein n=1 Tax=Giardia intestinalis (strain P15) TaxID=658858 RepID=E1EWG1_GIAIA|nr:Chorein [Giardia lamblia P15]
MLNEMLTRILTKYISKYVYELNSASMRSSLLRGIVELTNLFIRPEALDMLQGVRLAFGYVEHVSLRIPWQSFWKENISVKVSTVYVVVYGHSPDLTEDAIKQQILSNFKNKLKSLIRIEQRILEQSKEQIVQEIGTTARTGTQKMGKMKQWILWLQNLAINNVALAINNVAILWSAPELRGVSGALCLQSILVATADSSAVDKLGLKEKDCTLKSLTFRYYSVSVDEHSDHNYNSRAECEKGLLFWRPLFEGSAYITVIDPFQVTTRVQLCRNFAHENKPFVTIQLQIPNICCCTDLQTILSLVKSFSTSIAAGEFAFALTSNEVTHLIKNSSPDDAVKCLGKVLIRSQAISKIETLISTESGRRLSSLKDHLHRTFKKHYLSHLRCKYITPLLPKCGDPPVVNTFSDEYLNAVQDVIGYVGPSAKALAELTASIPTPVVAKLQQECISAFLHNLLDNIEQSKREILTKEPETSEHSTPIRLSRKDLAELQKVAGVPSTLDISDIGNSSDTGEERLELVKIVAYLKGIDIRICKTIADCSIGSTSAKLLRLSLQTISCAFSLLKSTDFTFSCELSLIRGECAAAKEPVLTTLSESSAFSIGICSPGRLGGSIYVKSLLVPIHVICVPSLLPFVINLMTVLQSTFSNTVKVPIQKASSLDLVTLYNEIDKGITAFLQERAATLELDLELGAPVVTISAPATKSFSCSLGQVSIKSLHFLSEMEHPKLTPKSQTLVLFVQLSDTTISIRNDTRDDSIGERTIGTHVEEEVIVRPCSVSIYLQIPLVTGPMIIDISQSLFDTALTTASIQSLMLLCNRYAYELLYIQIHKQNAVTPPVHQDHRGTLARQRPGMEDKLEQTMLLLRNKTATVIITVTLEGAKLAIGDSKEVEVHVGQGYIEMHAITMQNKSSCAEFKLDMLDFFICGTPVAYLTNETEDYEDDRITSGSWTTDKGITLKLEIGMLHIVADIMLIIKLTSVLEKLLQFYSDTGLALLWSQISCKLSSSQAQSQPLLQEHNESTIALLIDFAGLEIHLLSTPYLLPVSSDLELALDLNINTALICTARLKSAYFNIILDSTDVFINWSFHECVLEDSESEPARVTMLQFITPITSEVCAIGCIHLYSGASYDPNLLLHAQIIGDVLITINGRLVQYLLHNGSLLVDCLFRIKELLGGDLKVQLTGNTTIKSPSRISCNIFVPSFEINIPVQIDHTRSQFSLRLINFETSTDQTPGSPTIKLHGCLEQLLFEFMDTVEEHECTYHTICAHDRLKIDIERTYRVHHQERCNTSDSPQEHILLAHQLIVIDLPEIICVCLTPRMLHAAMELIGADKNLGFIIVDDTDESKLRSIKQTIDVRVEDSRAQNSVSSSMDTITSINRLLAHDFKGFFGLDTMSIRAQLKLDDSFIDIIEQEYIKISRTADEEHAQLERLNQFCPPVVNTLKISVCTLNIKLVDKAGTLFDCELRKSNITLEQTADLQASGFIESLTLKATESPFPLFGITQVLLQYRHDSIHRQATLLLPQKTNLTMVVDRIAISMIFSLLELAYTPSTAYVLARQTKQELIGSINEKISILQERTMLHMNKGNISHALLSALHISQTKKTIAIDKPTLEIKLSLLTIKFVIIVSVTDPKGGSKLESIEHVALHTDTSVIVRTSFRQKYVISEVDCQVQDFFRHTELYVALNLDKCRIASCLAGWKTGAESMQLNNIVLVPKLSCTFTTVSTDMQGNFTEDNRQKDIVLNKQSSSVDMTIAKQAEITISSTLLCVYLLAKERLLGAIPHKIVKETKQIAKEKLEKIKSRSIEFLKGTSDSQAEKMTTTLIDAFPTAVLNTTPIMVSGFHFPVYTISTKTKVELSFKNYPLLISLTSSQNALPLFIVGCKDIRCTYESVPKVDPNVPHQALVLTASLYAKSYNEALKSYDALLCSVPIALSYKMQSRSLAPTVIAREAPLDTLSMHSTYKAMLAEISISFSAQSELLVLLTPTALLAMMHFIGTFSIPASKSLQTESAQRNTNSILKSKSADDEKTTDESFISSISTTSPQPIDPEGQQVIEFYPSSIVQAVKVYSGSSECSVHSATGGVLIFYISLSRIEDASIWIELLSEGVVKTIQLPLCIPLFHEQYNIDEDWGFVFISQSSRIEVHCLSTCILLNYTTGDYSFIAETPISSSIRSTDQLYSSTETISTMLSSMPSAYSTTVCASVDCNSHVRPQLSGTLRKSSYISVPRSVTSFQISYKNHGPLELLYYVHHPATYPLETFITETGYEYMRLIVFTVHLFGRPTQVMQLVPTHFITNGMPCMTELKLSYVRGSDSNSGLETREQMAALAPVEFVTLNTSLKDKIQLASLSVDLQYGVESYKYILKSRYDLAYNEDFIPSQPVALDLMPAHQDNTSVYHCNASIKKRTMKKISGIDVSLLKGLYAPSAVELKIYATALLQNNTAPELSFCIFRLDSKYDKRTQITTIVKYEEASIIWGNYSDSIKLSVSVLPTIQNDNPIQYHKSDSFRLSAVTGYHLHRMHAKTEKKKMTLFVCSISKQLKGSPSMMYTLHAAIKVNNLMPRPISVFITPWDHKDKTAQKAVRVDSNASVSIFELPGTKERLIDYAVRFPEDQKSLLKRLKIGYSKELFRIDSSLAVVEIHCIEYKLNITVRVPKAIDDVQLKVFNSLNLDLYCSYKHSSQHTKYTIASRSTTTLYFLLSDLNFYYQKSNGAFSQIFCIKMIPLSTDVEFNDPRSKKKCHAKLIIREGAVHCKIFSDNEASSEPAMGHHDANQGMLINANLEIKKIRVLLVGPDDSDFSCRKEYVSLNIAFVDVVSLVSAQYYLVSAQMGQLSFENILGLTNQPRILHLKPVKLTKGLHEKRSAQKISLTKDLEAPAIMVVISLSTNLSILDVDHFKIKIGKLNIHIDQSTIDVILRFLRINTLLSISFQIESTERQSLQAEVHHLLAHLNREDKRYHVLLRKLCNCVFNVITKAEACENSKTASRVVCVRQLEIAAVRISATVSITNFPLQLSPVISILNQVGIISFSIEDARIRMGAFRLKNRLLTSQELTQHLCRSYIKAISMNAGNLLVATPMLGNLSSLATHFTESFSAPKNEGVTRIENFVSHNTAGVMSVARALFESTGKMLDAASMDSKHSAQRAIVLYESQKSLKTAWKNAGNEFWRELRSGLVGLISKPRKGFAAKGVKGFFRGLGQGLVGSITKSLGSINDAILHVIVGINGSALRICRPVMNQGRSRTFIGPLLEQEIREHKIPDEPAISRDSTGSDSGDQESTNTYTE